MKLKDIDGLFEDKFLSVFPEVGEKELEIDVEKVIDIMSQEEMRVTKSTGMDVSRRELANAIAQTNVIKVKT